MRLNKTEIAWVFEMSRNAITDWVVADCPIVSHGRRGKEARFDLEKVIEWRSQHLKWLTYSPESIALTVKMARQRARQLARRKR